MRVYLAGPDVFLPDARGIGARKQEICTRYGLTGLFPLDHTIDPAAPGASLQIFRANEAMMQSADAIIANLTPFRGPSADAGTVYELGYMAGLGRLCLGYSNDPRDYVDRLGGASHDAEGHTIENFALADNLMIVHALDTCGEPLVKNYAARGAIWSDLSAFHTCVELAARHARAAHSDR